MTDLPPYEERYVAFLDLLGFKELVRQADLNPALLSRLARALINVREYAKTGAAMDASAGHNPQAFFYGLFRMSTFSDSVVISTKANPIGLAMITWISAVLCMQLLREGLFVRGGLSRGKLIHTDDIVLGDGLIAAYKLESSAAVYPRLLVAESLNRDLDEIANQGGTPDLRRRDFDGMTHIHILQKTLLEFAQGPAGVPQVQDFMVEAREAITAALHDPDAAVRAKGGWMARYFNEYAPTAGIQSVTVPQ